MSDFVVVPRGVERKVQQRSLQIMLLGMTVPFKEGGGLVFPIGYPFAGYRLGEWEFERYRARLSDHLLSDGAAHDTRRALLAYYLLFGLAFVGTALLAALARKGTFGDVPYQYIPLLWLAPFLVIGIHTYAYCYRLYKLFEQSFHGSPRVPRHAYYYRRSLGYLVGQSFHPLRGAFFSLLSGACGAYFLALSFPSQSFGWTVFGLLMLLVAAFKFSQCIFYWHFRLTRGRLPGPEDLQPV